MEMPLVRYYVYASDVKIDMIYSQIPPKLLSRIVGELKLDLKVLALSLRKRETDETLYSKLGVVENYLDNEFEVGSVAESGAWFRGALPMRSGVWSENGEPGHPASDGLLYFSGLQDGVLVALIGSAHHQIGVQSATSTINVRYSGLPELFSVLEQDEPTTQPSSSHGVPSVPDDKRVIREVFDFTSALKGIRQPSEFLARRLLHGPVEDESGSVQHLLLGTPVYVALSED